jgi:nucleoside-diphosphate-sugar epimerase
MKILVTGSSGMVGKEVVKELKRKKHTVIEFDVTTGKNILDEKQLEKELTGAQGVIHLAGIIQSDHPKLLEINVEGTKKALNSAIKKKVKKFLFMSTTGVYGETKGIVNEITPINPQNQYEKSKSAGEELVLNAKEKIGVVIVRSAMVFGPNDYWKKMFSMLEKKYPLPCSGENTFQVVYVKELARAIVTTFEKGKPGEIYLIGGKEKKTLNEFCELVQKELGLKVGVLHIPATLGIFIGKILGIKLLTSENIRHLSKERNYDTSKIESLGHKPKTTLKEEIKEVVSELKKSKQV